MYFLYFIIFPLVKIIFLLVFLLFFNLIFHINLNAILSQLHIQKNKIMSPQGGNKNHVGRVSRFYYIVMI